MLPKRLNVSSFAVRLAVYLVLIALCPLLISSLLNYYYAEKSIYEEVMGRLAAVTQGKMEHVEGLFLEHRKHAAMLAENPNIKQALAELVKVYDQGGRGSEEAGRAIDRRFRPTMEHYSEAYEAANMFLLSPGGDVLFLLNSEGGFEFNLLTGPLQDSFLADAFSKAIHQKSIAFSGFSYFSPSREPTAFYAAPMFENKKILGVLVLQISIQELYEHSKDYSNLGNTGEIVIAVRKNEHAEFIAPLRFDKQAAFHRRVRIGSPGAIPIQKAVQGQHGAGYSIDYRGKEILALWRYLPTLQAGMVVKIDKNEAFAHVYSLEKWTGGIVGITLSVVIVLALLLARSVSAPIVELIRAASRIAEGDLSVKIHTNAKDEFGKLAEAFQQMLTVERGVVQHANMIAQGDYSGVITPRGERDALGLALQAMTKTLIEVVDVTTAVSQGDYTRSISVRGEHDQLGNTINSMTRFLAEVTQKTKREDWLRSRQNELNQHMLGEPDITTLASSIIGYLARHLDAQVGALYVMSDSGVLKLAGSYAFTKRKWLNATIRVGEGLVGQAAYEKEIISITNIPEDYTRITSSIGESLPRNLLVAPFLHDSEVIGVIELGSFEEFSDLQIELIRSVTDSVAIAFFSVGTRIKMQELLEETQRQAEELQAQQEELKTANEELEEQTRSLGESEKRLKDQHEELQAANEELEEKSESLEQQRNAIQIKNRELEETRRNLEKQAQELALASKYKSEFLSNMSHELRTPLNSLLLLSQSLAENSEGNLDEHQVKSATIINTCGKDLLTIINDILDLSKIEAGRMGVEREKVDLSELAFSLKAGFSHMCADRGIGFEIKVEGSAPKTIISDRQRLGQILKNLISNAVKFTSEGEVEVIFSRPDQNQEHRLKDVAIEDTLQIRVVDTGIGISQDKLQSVFEAFQQAEGGTAREYGGTGLGLSISRKLANLLGGEITLESEKDKGSTFTLLLPLSDRYNENSGDVINNQLEVEPGNSMTIDVPSQPSKSLNNKTPNETKPFLDDDRDCLETDDRVILVIEDDRVFAEILAEQCKSKGFKFLAAADGEEGLKLVAQYKPQGIILDLKLPGMDGWRVLEYLKTNPEVRHIPVHIMSAEEATVDAFNKGAIGFLTKPVTGDQIEGALNKIQNTISRELQELLVVDDDPVLRQEVVDLIGNGDVKTTQAGSGMEAIEALRANSFDCMVLDLGLPDMNGFELLDRLENDDSIDLPPVIVYTGRELTREENMALSRYAGTIIIKGVKSAERLLDETALFLHRVVKNLPERKQKMILSLHDQDTLFKDKKILLVDDDMRNVFALAKILKEKGMAVRMAADGQNALEVLNKEPDMDLVLMDIMMPVMDGYQTTRRIRKLGFDSLPIIALTAKAMKDDREKCLAAGANDYLAKPVEVERLLSMMRVWLYR